METTYFNIETKRVVSHAEVGERASGGTETVCYVCSAQRQVSQPRGQVVDMEEYRRQHCIQEKGAPVESAPEEESPVEDLKVESPRPRKSRGLVRLGVALDLMATAGILLLVAGVLIKIFAL